MKTIDKNIREYIELLESENSSRSLIQRLRLYLEDTTKRSSLMIRSASIISSHELGEFGIHNAVEEIQY
jgi:hypothetical protein